MQTILFLHWSNINDLHSPFGINLSCQNSHFFGKARNNGDNGTYSATLTVPIRLLGGIFVVVRCRWKKNFWRTSGSHSSCESGRRRLGFYLNWSLKNIKGVVEKWLSAGGVAQAAEDTVGCWWKLKILHSAHEMIFSLYYLLNKQLEEGSENVNKQRILITYNLYYIPLKTLLLPIHLSFWMKLYKVHTYRRT